MNKKELAKVCKLSPATVSKMGRGEFVSMDVLYRIGIELNADFGDRVSIISESKDDDIENKNFDCRFHLCGKEDMGEIKF